MLRPTVISRDVTTPTNETMHHTVAGAEYANPPTLVMDGFSIRGISGQAYDAIEVVTTLIGALAVTDTVDLRLWFYLPTHRAGEWISARVMEGIARPQDSSDVHAPARRTNSIPVGATRMYVQVINVAAAVTECYTTVFGVSGMVADVSVGDIEVDIEPASLGSVKIEDHTNAADKVHVKDADAAVAVDDHVLMVQVQGPDGLPMPSGSGVAGAIYTQDIGGGGAGGANNLYVSPQDCTVTFVAATQVTITGLPYVPVLEQFVSLTQIDAAGHASNYTPTTHNFAWNAAADTLTITGATLALTDAYRVFLFGPDKSYAQPQDATKTLQLNNTNEFIASSTLIEDTNIVDNVYDFYLDCAGYSNVTLQIIADGGSGTVTVHLEASIEDNNTAAAACVYEECTAELVGVASFVAVGGAHSEIWFGDLNPMIKYLKVEMICATGGANDSDATIFARLGVA